MFRAAYRSEHAEPLINFGIRNSITRLHLVGYFYWFILWCTDPWILNLIIVLVWHLPWATEEDHEISDRMASLETKIQTCGRIWRRSGIRCKRL